MAAPVGKASGMGGALPRTTQVQGKHGAEFRPPPVEAPAGRARAEHPRTGPVERGRGQRGAFMQGGHGLVLQPWLRKICPAPLCWGSAGATTVAAPAEAFRTSSGPARRRGPRPRLSSSASVPRYR